MGMHVNSAGGLLGGVMANTRPGLFSAMVMKVLNVGRRILLAVLLSILIR